MAKKDDAVSALWRMDTDQKLLLNELMDDMTEFGANCVEVLPSPWTDYGDEDEPFAEPSASEAAMLCAGCPVVESCFDFANKYRPTHGGWGGVKFRRKVGKF